MSVQSDIRNVAIVAHVDHGKTTLVDHLLRQSGVFRKNEEVDERILDTLDQEKERGITIASKNCALKYGDTKINVIDTPGHSDFGGEVERVLNMAEGALLLVDASEGPLPQTRFVLQRAIDQELDIILCINKIDRSDARVSEVVDEVFELFMELGASEQQLDFPILYTVAVEGFAVADPEDEGEDLELLFEAIVEHVSPPEIGGTDNLQLMVSDLGYDDYLGRLALGRIESGRIEKGEEVCILQADGSFTTEVTELFIYEGLGKRSVEKAEAGEIVAVAGMSGIEIGDTVAGIENPVALPRISVENPTVSISVQANDGPFAAREGEFVTGRKLLERLRREDRNNVAINLEETERSDCWILKGRGQLQLAVIIEKMRREGYELIVGTPRVLIRENNGREEEPVELVVIDLPETFVGAVTEKLGARQGEMVEYKSIGSNRVRLKFKVPTRGMIGYRSEFQTDTRGEGIITSRFDSYRPKTGEINRRNSGALIADRGGEATPYALEKLQARGRLFIPPGTECYEGMIVGEHSRPANLDVNVTKQKQLTNFRAAGSDDAVQLEPHTEVDIEFALDWINDQELAEITPESVRLRRRELDQRFRD
ncbi:MAG: translational GTPase TypA [bacterium]